MCDKLQDEKEDLIRLLFLLDKGKQPIFLWKRPLGRHQWAENVRKNIKF
jgi:hypothetical protein